MKSGMVITFLNQEELLGGPIRQPVLLLTATRATHFLISPARRQYVIIYRVAESEIEQSETLAPSLMGKVFKGILFPSDFLTLSLFLTKEAIPWNPVFVITKSLLSIAFLRASFLAGLPLTLIISKFERIEPFSFPSFA